MDIAGSMIATTLYHARAGQPIPWKQDRLYAVTVDPPDNTPPQSVERHPEYPPFNLACRDAKAIYASKIPRRAALMAHGPGGRLGAIGADRPGVTGGNPHGVKGARSS